MASLLSILKPISKVVGAVQTAQGTINNIKSVGRQVEGRFNQAKNDPFGFIQDLVRGETYGTSSSFDPFVGMNQRGDAIQNWSWYCELPELGPTPLVNGIDTLPWYYVPAATMPFRNITSAQINRLGGQRNYPENYSVDDLTLTFFVDTSNAAFKYATGWTGRVLGGGDPKVVGNRGMWGLPGHYKRDIKIHITSADRTRLLTATYTGCWPTNINQISLESNSSEQVQMQVTFKVDDVHVTIVDGTGMDDARFPFLGTQGFSLGSISFKNLPQFGKIASSFSKFLI